MTVHRWPDLSPLEVAVFAFIAGRGAPTIAEIASGLEPIIDTTIAAIEVAIASLEARGAVGERLDPEVRP